MINAIVPIWKPVNWTSFDVVKKIRNKIKPAKVGHAGTLDPFAEGVLVICTGLCTKKVNFLMNEDKEYIATIELGKETDTLDLTGTVINESKIPIIKKKDIIQILKEFIGYIKQRPPMYSAIKYKGERLYKFARKGIIIPRELREVRIDNIELLDFKQNKITIRIVCGKGTYIRSLAKDISRKLQTFGHLISLKRIRIGSYKEINCIKIQYIQKWISAQI